MDWRALRRRLGSTGWTVLLYYLLLNICVVVFMVAEIIVKGTEVLAKGDIDAVYDVAMEAASGGWAISSQAASV